MSAGARPPGSGPHSGEPPEPQGGGIISLFVSHPNAANLLMVLMVIFGVFSLTRINTQFFPSVEADTITVSVSWPGASAED
ncbi:MAG TPA: efflux RND transporter permease subunit, partial [Afifellaceae bacterium]|nr:efflux RND transporter permease subunit [Afifellaceae bacterium]